MFSSYGFLVHLARFGRLFLGGPLPFRTKSAHKENIENFLQAAIIKQLCIFALWLHEFVISVKLSGSNWRKLFVSQNFRKVNSSGQWRPSTQGGK
jgi:hypothetical protein